MNSDIILSMGKHTYIAKIKKIIEDGKAYYLATFPTLNGCSTEGSTFDEAVYMAKDLLHGYIEWSKKDGFALPSERKSLLKKASTLNIPISVSV